MGLASDGLGSNPERTIGQVTVYFQISYVRGKKKKRVYVSLAEPPPAEFCRKLILGGLLGSALRSTPGRGGPFRAVPSQELMRFALGRRQD